MIINEGSVICFMIINKGSVICFIKKIADKDNDLRWGIEAIARV